VIAGRDAELDVAVAEPGILRADRDVGQQGHHGARADGHAVDRRDDRLLAVDDVVDQVAHLGEHVRHPVVIAGHPPDHVQVAAGRERLTRSGDHGHPGIRVGGDFGPDPGEFAVHLLVGGVVLVRPVHGDDQHALVPAFEAEALVLGERHE
jgi:hypothetical protein